jgi:hypothetical protein
MEKELFLSLKKEAEADLKIPDELTAMMDLALILPSIVQKWNEYYTHQNYVVKMLDIKKAELYAKLEEEWKFHKNVAWQGRELNDQIQGDPQLLKLERERAAQNYYLDYIKGIYDNVKGISFTIKDYLKYKELIKI